MAKELSITQIEGHVKTLMNTFNEAGGRGKSDPSVFLRALEIRIGNFAPGTKFTILGRDSFMINGSSYRLTLSNGKASISKL